MEHLLNGKELSLNGINQLGYEVVGYPGPEEGLEVQGPEVRVVVEAVQGGVLAAEHEQLVHAALAVIHTLMHCIFKRHQGGIIRHTSKSLKY